MTSITSLIGAGLCGITVCSCALPAGSARHATAFPTSQESARYEVRRAIAATAPFEPHRLKSYYVMIAPANPVVTRVAAKPQLATDSRVKSTPHPVATAPGQYKIHNVQNVRTTAYCHDEKDHLIYGKLSAIGQPLRFGAIRSAAADWSRYPLGTLFRIAGQPSVIYQVDDYGSALVGTNTIDLYKPSRSQMHSWGVRHIDIEVIKWGSYQQSMETIKDRTRFPHVRKMFNDLHLRLNHSLSPPAKEGDAENVTRML